MVKHFCSVGCFFYQEKVSCSLPWFGAPQKDNKIIPYYINQEVMMKVNNNFRAQHKIQAEKQSTQKAKKKERKLQYVRGGMECKNQERN